MIEFFAWIFRATVLTVAAAGWLGLVFRWPWEPVKVEPGQARFEKDENGEYWRVRG